MQEQKKKKNENCEKMIGKIQEYQGNENKTKERETYGWESIK